MLGQAVEHPLERQELGPRGINRGFFAEAQSAGQLKLESQFAR